MDTTFKPYSENLVSVIKNLIITKLGSYEPMWINYKKLHVQSFDNRTTSMGESIQSSMKRTDDGCISNRNLHTATDQI